LSKKYQISIIDYYFSKKKHFYLVNIFILEKMSSLKRTKLLYQIINDEKLEGLIELWFDTGIIDKPKNEILAIIISKYKKI
jgi:hypothetical protein